jgi:hypothetical protein
MLCGEAWLEENRDPPDISPAMCEYMMDLPAAPALMKHAYELSRRQEEEKIIGLSH